MHNIVLLLGLMTVGFSACQDPHRARTNPQDAVRLRMGATAPAATIMQWREQLQSPQKSTRLNAVELLSKQQFDYEPASLVLFDALKDNDAEVRAAAIAGLKQCFISGLPIVPALIGYLKTGPDDVRVFALETLNQEGDRSDSLAPQALELMRSPSPAIRRAAMHFYVGHGKDAKKYSEAIHLQLKDPDLGVRADAAIMYLQSHDKDEATALPAILQWLQSPIAQDRVDAASSLSNIKTHNLEIAQALIPPTRDNDAIVRRCATLALGHQATNDPAVLRALEDRLKDSIGCIRNTAALALLEISADPYPIPSMTQKDGYDLSSAAPALLEMCRNRQPFPHATAADLYDSAYIDDREARSHAFKLLGRIGATDATIAPKLIPLLTRNPTRSENGAYLALAAISAVRPALVDTLLEGSKKNDEPSRAWELSALFTAQRNRPETLAVLRKRFDEEQSIVRHEALLRLIAVDRLRLVGDFYRPPFDVSEWSSEDPIGNRYTALTWTEDAPSRAWIVRLLHDRDTTIREYAASCVLKTPLLNQRVIETLFALLDSPDLKVRTAAGIGLLRGARSLLYSAKSVSRSVGRTYEDLTLLDDKELKDRTKAIHSVLARLHRLPETEMKRILESDLPQVLEFDRFLDQTEAMEWSLNVERKRRKK